MHRQSFWSGLVVVGFALLALHWIIPGYAGRAMMRGMPPDLLPRVAAWLMLVSGLFVVGNALFHMWRTGEAMISTEVNWGALGWSTWPFVYVGFAVWLATMFKVTYIGAPVIAGMLILLGERRWYVVIPCAIVPVIALYVLSVYMMRIGVV